MLLDKVYDSLAPYLKKNEKNRLILAISGGIDGIVLLHTLNKIKSNYSLEILLIHINYGMQKKSNNAESLCSDLSLQYGFKIILEKVKLNKDNFESNARNIRYKIFNTYAEKNNFDYILTAHHRDDQIETLHMKFLDNADWVSFLGIRKKYGKILRPMLDISKEDIYSYANKNKLKWVEDDSNEDLNYRRNNIRLNVIPEIIKNNPNHIDLLMKKHSYALEKISLLKNEIKSLKKKYIIEVNSKFLILSNSVIEISDKVIFKVFYQDLSKNYFDYRFYSTKKHWKQFHLFISESRTGSSFILDEKIKISKGKRDHCFLYN